MKLVTILPLFLILAACGSNAQTDNGGGGLNLVKQISAGSNYICGITLDNIPKCLGEDNNDGQQGDGTTNANYTTVQVKNLPHASFVSANITNTCFLTDGNVFCSGNNNWGQLGNGTFTNSFTPVQVTGISNIQQLSAGSGSACALRNDGAVFCWGSITEKNTNVPIQLNSNVKFKSISNNSVYYEYCGVSTLGEVWCWLDTSLHIEKINNLSNIVSVTSGGSFSCVLNQSGQVFCWGSDESGQLGDGKNETQGRPVQVLNVNNFSSIFSSQETTCGITTDGKTYCWGRGLEGQLGNGDHSNSNIPVLVNTNIQFTQITGSLEATYAIDQNGNTYVWGKRDLTSSTTQKDLTPVQLKF